MFLKSMLKKFRFKSTRTERRSRLPNWISSVIFPRILQKRTNSLMMKVRNSVLTFCRIRRKRPRNQSLTLIYFPTILTRKYNKSITTSSKSPDSSTIIWNRWVVRTAILPAMLGWWVMKWTKKVCPRHVCPNKTIRTTIFPRSSKRWTCPRFRNQVVIRTAETIRSSLVCINMATTNLSWGSTNKIQIEIKSLLFRNLKLDRFLWVAPGRTTMIPRKEVPWLWISLETFHCPPG